MSLSSFLLHSTVGEGSSKKAQIDRDLEVIFRSNAKDQVEASYVSSTTAAFDLKRKLGKSNIREGNATKRVKHVDETDPTKGGPQGSCMKRSKPQGKAPERSATSDCNADHACARPVRGSAELQDGDGSVDSDTGSYSDPSNLVHESLRVDRRTNDRRKKSKFVPPDESPQTKDGRTIFIGNVPAEVAKSRPLLKQLKRHVLSFVPAAKIESTRCRSVAFQAPTTKLPASDDEDQGGSKSKGKGQAQKQARQHDVQRVSSWRDSRAFHEDAEISKDEKKYLTPQEKKRIAFIHHELHPDVDTVNVYLVFAYPTPGSKTETTDPFEAVRMSVEHCNGTVFADHTIRVDHVGKSKTPGSATGAAEDPKSTLFVGNLDFACKEEDVRAFFEALMNTARGPPPSDCNGSSEEQNAKRRAWVVRVRIIRDKDTQLGKGFAYVQFADRDCVDEILGLDENKLKFAKRKLRVQRCKSMTANTCAVKDQGRHTDRIGERSQPANATASSEARRPSNHVPVIPKGNPALGEKIAHLPKDARKQAKASDPDRVARRLAKKKAGMALGNQGVKIQGAARERIRKPKAKISSVVGKESKKRRVRSDKSVLRKNTKK